MHPERRFYFELAERLGCTVSELLDRISSEEITEWAAVWKIRQDEQERAQKEAERRAKVRSR